MRSSVFAIAMTMICTAADLAGSVTAAAQSCTAASKSTICESFDKPWTGNTSPSGNVRINGPWVGTGGNYLDPTLAQFGTDNGGRHVLTLSVAAGVKRG